jgi:phosphate transport system substrate-binding protein
MSSYYDKYTKRHGIGGAIVGVIVIVVIIVSALAGYEAAASSAGTKTITSTLSGSTTTVTGPATTVTETISGGSTVITSDTTVTSNVTTTTTLSGTPVCSTSSSTSTTSPSSMAPAAAAPAPAVATPVLPAFGGSSLPTPSGPITEAGSSLLAPLFGLWAANFTNDYSNVKVSTAAGGSGAGQTDVETNTTNIGGSDPFLSNAQVNEYPDILNIAVAVSAQQVNYNLPGIAQTMHLNFTGNVLAGIYNGTITMWNAPAIVAINPGAASMLPAQTIVPLHRSDSSGDTNLFTTYLSDTSPDWLKNVGSGNTVSWPSVPTALAENGNSGMVTAAQQTPYSIAYIGVSYLAQATTDGLGNADLQNLAGHFVQLTTPNVESAVSTQCANTPPSERISLIYGPGANSYPIVNYEYAMVQKNQPNAALATDIQALLNFATLPTYGNSPYFLNQVGFVPLPASVAQLTWAQIDEITG